MKKILIVTLLVLSFSVFSQNTSTKDKAIFKEYNPGYYQNTILKGIDDYEAIATTTKSKKRFKMDFTGMDIPNSTDLYTRYWSTPPISQGNTNTCWSYSTTSFLESEVYRLYKKEVKLSEMHTVYYEYIERAKEYVKMKGTSAFAEGSEANAVTRMWKKYGIVPESDYTGMLPGQTIQNHAVMYEELLAYLKSVKASNTWNEEIVLATVKSILNSYMGAPPTTIMVDGKQISPLEYLNNIIKINPDDYISVMSLMEKSYYTKAEYDVPDNWWNSDDYYNVPLDVFMNIVKTSIKNGYTMAIGGDVSEPGYESDMQVGVIPTFDIPSEYIDENARQFRFSNESTTDDHGIHIVGYYEKDGITWFLIKDSGAGSRNAGKDSKNFGYYFYHEDYIKLKMMNIMVHKDMVKDVLKKFTN
ncbi:MAG TPA: C1 family peptidase [Bacteroidales bacterium]|nr:C1 family peptidase [Bacteroidales bacterium]HQI45052.1 C1 family peptidase [Bacteroidales bacterium]